MKNQTGARYIHRDRHHEPITPIVTEPTTSKVIRVSSNVVKRQRN